MLEHPLEVPAVQGSKGQEIMSALEKERYVSLETFRRDGAGVRTPIWFAERGGVLYVYTLAGSGKVKRIRNNPLVRIAPCNARGTVHGEWVDARARIVVGEEATQGMALLNARYGWQKRLLDFFSGFGGKPRAVLAIEPVRGLS